MATQIIVKLLRKTSFLFIVLGSVTLFFLASTLQLLADDMEELTAEEILAKSEAAMNQPLSYKIIVPDVMEMIVYRKRLPDGSFATLHDIKPEKSISLPNPIRKTTIHYGKKYYDLYFEDRIAIDMGFRYQSQRSKENIIDIIPTANHQLIRNYKPVELILYGGSSCYKIESESTNVPIRMNDENIEPQITKPIQLKRERCIINKETFFFCVFETISSDGTSLTKFEFKDMTPQPDLSDDFFQLPADFDVKVPTTEKEHSSILSGIIRAKLPPPPPPPELPSLESIIAPLPPRTVTTPAPLKLSDQTKEEVVPQPVFTARRIVFIFGNIILITLIIFSIYWGYKKIV
jgi:hypothetical protein